MTARSQLLKFLPFARPLSQHDLRSEVCVLGGGPAGSAVARRLAQLGHSVIVVEKAAFPRQHVGESIPGSVLPLLEVLGLRERLEAAGFLRPHGAIVRWGSEVDRTRGFGEAGFQVERGRFDQILLESAVECGVMRLQPARVLELRQHKSGWMVRVSVDGRTLQIDADFLVDATGRANLPGGKRLRRSAPMLALWAYWRYAGAMGDETRVEAGPTEWFWGAPLPDGSCNATVFIDPVRYRDAVRKYGGLNAFYESLLHRSALLQPYLLGTRRGTVRVCDATCYTAEEMVGPHSIKVGEAAFAIDPLSSQGVQTAIGTALHAAAVVHTILRRPGDTRIAMKFYTLRQAEASDMHAKSAAALYAQAADFYGTAFWLRSINIGNEMSTNNPMRATPAILPSPETRVQISPAVRIEPVPCVQSDYIVEMTGLVHSQSGHSIAFVGDMAVGPLLAELQEPLAGRDLVRRWSRKMAPEVAFKVFAQLWESGILCAASRQSELIPREGVDLRLPSAF